MSLPVVAFLVIFALACGYAAGRMHQWYRHALERDAAWRDGYDQGSGTLFKVATRVMRRKPGESTADILLLSAKDTEATATVTDITDAPSAGRHSFDLRYAVTRRLPVDKPEQASDEKVV